MKAIGKKLLSRVVISPFVAPAAFYAGGFTAIGNVDKTDGAKHLAI